MNKRIIDANGARYIGQIPEFKDELPIGILNKKRADVGGTFAVLNFPTSYIIVVPSLSLISSIKNDKNVPYKVFDVRGGTDRNELYKYLEKEKVHKIVVTYDSFSKLIRWLKSESYNLNNYKILIDEFHLLLENYGFRSKAIDNLLKSVFEFNHVTYMSATPISDDFISSALGNVPITNIDWGIMAKTKVIRLQVNSTIKSLVSLIMKFESEKGIEYTDITGTLTRVKELYIFINTVKDIASIIKTAKLDPNSVKVVCSDKIRNKTTLRDVEIKISDISDGNKKINFFTSKAFQGCNIFTNNGLVIAASTGIKKHTLIDVSSTLYQIHGRLRLNSDFQNVFRHNMVHIYSVRHKGISNQMFNRKLKESIIKSKDMISTYNKLEGSERETNKILVNKTPFFTEYDPDNDTFIMSKLKICFAMYQQKLHNHMYKSGSNLEKSYNKDHFDVDLELNRVHLSNEIELKLAINVNFKTLIKEYISLREIDEEQLEIEKYEFEYPFFKDAYDELGAKGISSCKYSEKKIKNKLEAISADNIDTVHKALYDHVGEGNFISVADAKKELIKIYKKNGIDLKDIGFTAKKILGRNSPYVFKPQQKRVDNKKINGFELRFSILNWILGMN